MQGQDDNDATLRPLRDVHAINSRIEFGSVPISPVEVRIQILLPSVPQYSHDPFLRQTSEKNCCCIFWPASSVLALALA